LAKLEYVVCSNSHLCGTACSASPVSAWLLLLGKSSTHRAPVSQRLFGTGHYSHVGVLPQNRSLMDTRVSARRIGVACWSCDGSSTSPLPSCLPPSLPSCLPPSLPSSFRRDLLSSSHLSLRALRTDQVGAGDPSHYARAAASARRIGLEQASLPGVCTALVSIPTLQAGPRQAEPLPQTRC
jgi:hypothetical protein